MNQIKKIWRLATAALLLAGAVPVGAAGLRTQFGEVIVSNLKIGQTYSLYKLLNLPLRVVNTGSETTDLAIETIRVNPSEIKAGYAPIPSLDWVRVERSTFTIAPNREAVTDLIITIPNDPSLLGRRFEADIWSHMTSHRAFLVGLQSRLLIEVDSTPPTEEELKKKFVDETVADLDFTILPLVGQVPDVPLGRDVELRKEKIVIKMINPSDRPLNFRVRSIPVWESAMEIPPGYVEAESADWLRPEKDVVKVEGNSISDVSMRLKIPDEDRLRGKKIFFVVSFEILEQKIPTRIFYRLMIETADAKGAAPKTK